MHEGILSQPAAIARVLEEEGDAAGRLAALLDSSERLHVVGVGTSWHAALVGEWLLASVAGRRDARAWNSFEFCTSTPPLNPEDAVVVLSHTGRKRYSALALARAQELGARTAVVTGLDSEAKTDLADVVVRTSPPERSAAYTVSNTTAMTALALVAAALEPTPVESINGATKLRDELKRLPDLVAKALEQEPAIREWAASSALAERLYFAGWGPNAATAYEVSLKIKETSYRVAEGFQLEQYLHGPFVATDTTCMVTLIAPSSDGRERAVEILAAAKAVGATTAAIMQAGDDAVASVADVAIPMPATPEPLTPIVYLVPLQLLTYWLAVEVGTNPDVFRLDDPTHRAAREKYGPL